jgi:Dolichyl-phosphate-mannose-protein mannosyltransferase
MTSASNSRFFRGRLFAISLIIPAIFVVTFLAALASGSRSVNLYDEGVIVTGAARVMAGEIIHRDFYANYGPAQFYVLAALFKLFGPSILVARIWGALVKAGIAVAIYLLGKRVMPSIWSLVSSVFSMVWLLFVDNAVWPAWPALLASIVSVLLLFGMFENGSVVKNASLSGACVGVATLFRYDIGFIVCVAEAAVLLPYSLAMVGSTTRLRSVGTTFGAYCAGIGAVCLPVAAAFCIAGAAGDMLFDVVQFPAHNYGATRSLPFPLPLRGRRPSSEIEYIVYFPMMMLFGVLIAAIPLNRSQSSLAPRFRTDSADSRRGMWELALLGVVMLSLIGKGLVRVGSTHMSLAVVPAMLILAGLLSANARRKISIGFSIFLGAALLVGVDLTLSAYSAVSARLVANVSRVIEQKRSDVRPDVAQERADSCRTQAGLERVACFKLAVDQEAAVHYIQENTTISDSIFVGLLQHERIFVNNVSFYFIANRRPATKWYHFDPGLQTTAPIQRLMIADLLRAKPKYIVLDSDWDGLREPNESSKSSGVRLLDEFIANKYERVAKFGSLTILKPVSASDRGRESAKPTPDTEGAG